MDIQLIRIDDRLIHGQVVVGWVKALAIERLLVVNDAIAANSMQRTLMEMAVPAGLQVQFLSLDEAASILDKTGDKKKTLLLISNPKDALGLLEKGVKMASINVGGMHFCEGKKQVGKTLCVNLDDVEAFRSLKTKGVEMEVRAVPSDMKESLEKYIPELK